MENSYFLLQQLLVASVGRKGQECLEARDDLPAKMARTAPAIVPAAPGLVERISARRANGQSFAAIAAELNKQGFSGRYGGRWYASSVSAYLQRHS